MKRRDYEALFWAKVERPRGSEPCWVWVGGTYRNGYGQATWQSGKISAHRLSWILHRGQIPVGMFVCHHCDNPPCVNPAHLFLGDAETNGRDMADKGRAGITGQKCIPVTDGSSCAKGHLFTHYDNRGWKKCRTCEREYGAAYRHRKAVKA